MTCEYNTYLPSSQSRCCSRPWAWQPLQRCPNRLLLCSSLQQLECRVLRSSRRSGGGVRASTHQVADRMGRGCECLRNQSTVSRSNPRSPDVGTSCDRPRPHDTGAHRHLLRKVSRLQHCRGVPDDLGARADLLLLQGVMPLNLSEHR